MRSHAVSHAHLVGNIKPHLYQSNLGIQRGCVRGFSIEQYFYRTHRGQNLERCRQVVVQKSAAKEVHAQSEQSPVSTSKDLGLPPLRILSRLKGTRFMSHNEILLTVQDAAQLLSVSPRTVTRLIARGEIESMSIGRCRRIRQRAVDRFIDTRQREQRQQAVGF
jgi:excisionase family DNA binding protein